MRTRRPSDLALIGLPQVWLFQLVFAAISPLIDLALLVLMVTTMLRVSQHGRAQTSGNVGTMALYWLAFTTVDIVYGRIGYRLDGRDSDFPRCSWSRNG